MTTMSSPDPEIDVLDGLAPSGHPPRDATHFRRVVAANEALARAEGELRSAVAAARAAGDSWMIVGTALGVSKQAAQQRFGRAFRGSLDEGGRHTGRPARVATSSAPTASVRPPSHGSAGDVQRPGRAYRGVRAPSLPARRWSSPTTAPGSLGEGVQHFLGAPGDPPCGTGPWGSQPPPR